MNANELADELEKDTNSYSTMCEAATMLRQQQAEIEALKKAFESAYEDGRADGMKFEGELWLKAKTLTDEEIAQVWVEHTKIAGTYDVKDIIFPFARAILRKANEK